MIVLMFGHHSFIYPLPINIFSTLNAECENGVLPVVFVHCVKSIVYCLEHDYLYLELASCFCSLRSTLCHQYSILKDGKMQ